MAATKFSVNPDAESGFFIIVGEDLTVYQSYEAAVAEIKEKISIETESFLAEVTIENETDDDLAINLEQISWQRIIHDMHGEASP